MIRAIPRPSSPVYHVSSANSVPTHSYSLYPTLQPPFITVLSSLSAPSNNGCLSGPVRLNGPITCSVFRKGDAMHFQRRYVGTAVDGKWRAIRTRGDEERLREGGSLRYWRRRTWIGRDFGVLALPGTRLRSLRGKVRVYPSSSRIREFIKTGERAYVRNSDGQGSSWSQ
jgi:hypothetical protein